MKIKNRFVNDEIICSIMDDDLELKYFRKLLLDGEEEGEEGN